MASYKEIADGKGEATVFSSLISLLKGKGLPTGFWGSGDPIPVILQHGLSPLLSTIYGFAADIAKGGFLRGGLALAQLDIASWNADPLNTFLGWLAAEVYLVTPRPPSFASGTLQITNAGGPVTLPARAAFSTTTGLIYRLVGGPLVVPAGVSYVTIEAEKSGAAYNVEAGQITKLVTSVAGLTVSNQANPPATTWLLVFGGDRESPESVALRCRANWARLSALQTSPEDAYVALALDPAITGTAAIRKVSVWPHYRDGVGQASNVITVYLAGDAGPVTNAQAALVQAGLLPWIGLHDTLLARPCGTVTYNALGRVFVRQAADILPATLGLVTAFAKLQTELQIGQTIWAFMVRRAVASVPQVIDYEDALVDFVPLRNQLITVNPGFSIEVGP